jgi:hypothetical protein
VRARAGVTAAILALTALVLSACSVRDPGAESLETAIPAALVASDLGITASEAGSRVDGFSVNVWASAELEADTLDAAGLRTMLQLVTDNVDLSDVNTLSITASVGPVGSDTDYIDLGALGAELGFDDECDTRFSAPWDDVVDFLGE